MTASAPNTDRKLSVVVEGFTPLRSNTLFGFCTVMIPELYLRIADLTVHESHGTRLGSTCLDGATLTRDTSPLCRLNAGGADQPTGAARWGP